MSQEQQKERYNMNLPTANDMTEFAKRFKKEEWDIISKNQEFLDAFGYDLPKCRVLAERILGEYNKKNNSNVPKATKK
mgnify:CR=1 FL=1